MINTDVGRRETRRARKDKQRANPHDTFVKRVFSDPETARGLVASKLRGEIVAILDMDSLVLAEGSFVDAELRESHSDLLYSVRFRDGRTGLIYILLEHKSSPDPMTPFQLLRYMVRIWESQQRDNVALSPIIPLILYHGETEWNTSRTMQDIIDAPPEMQCYVPQFESQLIDLSQYSDSELKEKVLYNAALTVLKYIRSRELPLRLPGIVQLFAQLTEERRGLECLRAALVYLSNGTDRINRQQLIEVVRNTLNKQEESMMPTIAEEWIQEGRVEGRVEGLEEGLHAGIRVVLELRFPQEAQALVDRTAKVHSTQSLREFLNLCKSAANPAELLGFLNQLPHS